MTSPDETTSLYQESLRPPGQSIPTPAPETDTAAEDADFGVTDDADDTGTAGDDTFDEDTSDDEALREDRMRHAGYDPDDVSGDTDAVRPR